MRQSSLPSLISGFSLTLPLLMTFGCADGSYRIDHNGETENFPLKLTSAVSCRVDGSQYVALTFWARPAGWGRAIRSTFIRGERINQFLLLRIPATAGPSSFSAHGGFEGYLFFLNEHIGPSGGFSVTDGTVTVAPHRTDLELSLEITPATVGPQTTLGLKTANRYQGTLSFPKVLARNGPQAVLEALRSGAVLVQPALQDWQDRVEQAQGTAAQKSQPGPS
jgi:hypothetical protein